MKKNIFLLMLALCLVVTGSVFAQDKRTDVTIITQVSPDSLDPSVSVMSYAYSIIVNISEPLMTTDAHDNLIPGLAESVEVNDDASEFVFKLRQGVKFHDGTDFTADDVVFTFEDNMARNVNNSAIIASVTAVNDYEVKVTLTGPSAPFLGILSTVTWSIRPRKAATELGDSFGRNPVGTGPYKFVEWVEGEYVKLEANEDYYLGAPEIKNATFKFIGDTNTALIAMEAGDADYSAVWPDAARFDIEANPDLKMLDYNSNSLQFMTMNVQNEYLSDKKVRQAINYAVNRDDIVIVAVEGMGRPTTQYCNVGTIGYVEGFEGYTYDVEKAKALMAESAYPDGFTIRVIAQDEMNSRMAQVMADNLSEIGINVEIEMQESNTAVANFMAGNYEIGVLGIGNLYQDFDALRRLWWPTNSLQLSHTDVEDEQLNKIFDLMSQAAALGDTDARVELYKQAEEEIWDAAYYIPCFFPIRSHIMASDLNIEGLRGTGYMHVYEMSWN